MDPRIREDDEDACTHPPYKENINYNKINTVISAPQAYIRASERPPPGVRQRKN